MPACTARSGTHGLPPFGFGGSLGSSGSTISQSSSLTNSLLMLMSMTSTHEQVLQGSLSKGRFLMTKSGPLRRTTVASKSLVPGIQKTGDSGCLPPISAKGTNSFLGGEQHVVLGTP